MNKEIGLAPMAGYTDRVMRELAIEWGADFVFSEMISTEGIVRSTGKTGEIVPVEPCRIQLFGADVKNMVDAAKKLLDVATWFDINSGCPVRKVVKRGAGSALLKVPEKIASMITALRGVVSVPVSVKIRIGIDKRESDRIIAPILKARPDAVFIHGRTVIQGYSGRADWQEIDRLAHLLHAEGISVYGSGDMFTPAAIANALEECAVDGVIVARGAIGNPWIFKQAKDFIRGRSYMELTLDERLNHFMIHLRRLADTVGEEQAIRDLRKSFAGYTRGIRDSAKLRNEYMKLQSFSEVREFLRSNSNVSGRIA